jgi:hypothetical protein
MTKILQSKLTKKLVLLFALIAALSYLRTPGRLHAVSCEKCATYYQECLAACATLGSEQAACDATCLSDARSCVLNCTE